MLQHNTSLKVARNTYASIGSGSLTSNTGYHYGLQNSNDNTKTTSTNVLNTSIPEDRSISPHNIKSKTQVKPTQREPVGIRKIYKKTASRGRGEVVATSSIVPGIRKISQIKSIPGQNLKTAQMSHQHVVVRDSLQNDNNSSIVRVTNNKPTASMRLSPDEKMFTELPPYEA